MQGAVTAIRGTLPAVGGDGGNPQSRTRSAPTSIHDCHAREPHYQIHPTISTISHIRHERTLAIHSYFLLPSLRSRLVFPPLHSYLVFPQGSLQFEPTPLPVRPLRNCSRFGRSAMSQLRSHLRASTDFSSKLSRNARKKCRRRHAFRRAGSIGEPVGGINHVEKSYEVGLESSPWTLDCGRDQPKAMAKSPSPLPAIHELDVGGPLVRSSRRRRAD